MGSGFFDKIQLIPEEDRYRIEAGYLRAINKISTNEYIYIDNSIEKKLYITENTSFNYIRVIGRYFNKLYEVLKNHQKGTAKLDEWKAKAIGAALLYFINPYDYFPDFTPGIGYCDDLFVLYLCLEQIGSKELTDLLTAEAFED